MAEEEPNTMTLTSDKKAALQVKINSFINNPNFNGPFWPQEEDQVQEYLRDGRYNVP